MLTLCSVVHMQDLTRSAYFLHRAASFSSGVVRELRACIKRTTSFPMFKKRRKKFLKNAIVLIEFDVGKAVVKMY